MLSETLPLGVRLPLMTGGIRPQGLSRICQTAVDLGYASLWVGDHVVPPTSVKDPYPYTATGVIPVAPDSPWLDPFLALTWIAAHTPPSVRLGTSIFLLPLRNVTLTAKQVSTLSWLSERGLSLGIGSGWYEKEYQVIGAPFDGRGRRVQDQMSELRPLLETGEFATDGTLAPMRPLSAGPIEFLWGGYSELALRIVARHCDGWLPTKCSFDELGERTDKLRRICDEEGRDFSSLRLVVKPGPGPSPEQGRIDQKAMAVYAEMGFHEVVLELPLNPTSEEECLQVLEEVAQRVAPGR